jgi:hypothetical protein
MALVCGKTLDLTPLHTPYDPLDNIVVTLRCAAARDEHSQNGY